MVNKKIRNSLPKKDHMSETSKKLVSKNYVTTLKQSLLSFHNVVMSLYKIKKI